MSKPLCGPTCPSKREYVRKKLAEAGVEVAPANPAQFASFVKRETAKYRAIVQAADIRE